MGFRINRGIFQYKKDDGTFANKFMLDKDSGRIMEVDEGGNMTDGYLKLGEKASDSDKLDGVDSGAFLRSNTDDNVTGHTEWQDNYQIRLGSGADLRMWHDGNNHVFRSYHHGANYYFQLEDNEGTNRNAIILEGNTSRSYVRLFEDGGERLRTTSAGVTIYGDLSVDEVMSRNTWVGNAIYFGGGNNYLNWDDSKINSNVGIRAANFLDSRDNVATTYRHSGSDFANGTLVKTNIPATGTSGASFIIEGTGKSYSANAPFSFIAQGYLYNNTIINYSGQHFGYGGFSQMKVFKHSDGNLAFWWTRVSYWNSFEIRVRDAGGSSTNRVTYIGNSTEPSSDKKVTINMKITATQDWVDGEFLRTGEKAADANLLDGINSSQFMRSDAEDTKSGNTIFTGNVWIDNTGRLGSSKYEWTNSALTTTSIEIVDDNSDNSGTSPTLVIHNYGDGGVQFRMGNTGDKYLHLSSAKADGAGSASDDTSGKYFVGVKVNGNILATQSYASSLAGEVNNRIETEIIPAINTAQSTADGAVTTANSALTTAQTAETRANSAKDQAAASLPLAGGTITGGITISGSLSRGTYTTVSQYHTGADNIVLKGNASGISGLFFESEKNGTNINHPSDFGFIQYHPYGTSTSGEANELIIGVSNDADDHVVFNAPNANGLKFRVGSSNTDYTVWHSGNFTNNSSNWNTAFNWGNHAGLYDAAGEAQGVHTRIDEDIIPTITAAQSTADNAANAAAVAQATANTAESRANGAREEAGAAYALADGKLGATAKAADANKLDGYDWMQSGKNIRASEFYADGWLRNYNSGKGLYNQATTQHFYSDDDDYWNVAGGTGGNGIRFRDEHNGTIRGYVYANNSSEVGLLDGGAHWAIKHTNDNGTRFYTDNQTEEFKVGRDAVTGSYGTVQTSTTRGGWGGYSIAGKYVFMSDHSSNCGIFNDIDNEWMAIFRRNAEVELFYNGALKLETKSNGVAVTGEVSAASFVGNGSGLTGVSAPIPFTTVTGEATACVSMNFDGRAMVFTMADGTSYSIDGARPNQ